MTPATAAPPRLTVAQRLLRSPVVDLLLGPHGVDRYLELIHPRLTVTDARAEVVAVRRQTPRSVTLTLRPNRAFGGVAPASSCASGSRSTACAEPAPIRRPARNTLPGASWS